MHAGLSGKRFELLKELLPKLSKVAVLAAAASPAAADFIKEAQLAAQTFSVELKVLSASNPSEIDWRSLRHYDTDALLVTADVVFTSHRQRIAELALKHRLPSMFGFRDMAEAGV